MVKSSFSLSWRDCIDKSKEIKQPPLTFWEPQLDVLFAMDHLNPLTKMRQETIESVFDPLLSFSRKITHLGKFFFQINSINFF
jgi:hypothetical protein